MFTVKTVFKLSSSNIKICPETVAGLYGSTAGQTYIVLKFQKAQTGLKRCECFTYRNTNTGLHLIFWIFCDMRQNAKTQNPPVQDGRPPLTAAAQPYISFIYVDYIQCCFIDC